MPLCVAIQVVLHPPHLMLGTFVSIDGKLPSGLLLRVLNSKGNNFETGKVRNVDITEDWGIAPPPATESGRTGSVFYLTSAKIGLWCGVP